ARPCFLISYAARTRMCPRFALARRLTRISTSLPSAARNSSNLSTEYSSEYPRISLENSRLVDPHKLGRLRLILESSRFDRSINCGDQVGLNRQLPGIFEIQIFEDIAAALSDFTPFPHRCLFFDFCSPSLRPSAAS